MQVDFPDSRVVLDHEEIPDFMDAMTMPFAVRDRTLLNGLDAGDVVSATLVVNLRDNRSWLEELRVVSKGQSIDSPSRTPGRDAKPGEAVPNVALVDQDGKPLRIPDYRGRALAFTFLFVGCPLPETCPRMTSHFTAVEKAPVADAALEELCRNYWFPLYACVRRRGYSPEDAEDLTQDFFLQLLRKNSVDPTRRNTPRGTRRVPGT